MRNFCQASSTKKAKQLATHLLHIKTIKNKQNNVCYKLLLNVYIFLLVVVVAAE